LLKVVLNTLTLQMLMLENVYAICLVVDLFEGIL
jgi:hypothetical protein